LLRELSLLGFRFALQRLLLLFAERLPDRVELRRRMERLHIPGADDGAHEPRALLPRPTAGVPDAEDERGRSERAERTGVTVPMKRLERLLDERPEKRRGLDDGVGGAVREIEDRALHLVWVLALIPLLLLRGILARIALATVLQAQHDLDRGHQPVFALRARRSLEDRLEAVGLRADAVDSRDPRAVRER